MSEQLESKIRVLIVDDIPETRENVRKLLYFEKDIEVVGAAASGSEGIEMARDLRPDIVLMDINMPDIDGITATESIAQSAPEVQIVMMSVQGETDYLRRSMLAGAREFLVKPFSADELIASIRRVYQLKPRTILVQPEIMRPQAAGARLLHEAAVATTEGEIVSVYSPKGGSGCSTIAINLALSLKNEEGRVALVDGDLQFGDVAVLLNMQPTRCISDLVPHMDTLDVDFLSDVLVSHPSGTKILLAPPRPDVADMITADDIKDILRNLKLLYDYTIVDTASYLDDIVLTILEISDRILLVMTPDIPNIKNVRLFLEALDALGYVGKTKLVVNKIGRSDGITDKDIAAHIRHPVWATVPRDNGPVTAAANKGIPLVFSGQRSPVVKSIAQVADLLRAETAAEAEKSRETASNLESATASKNLIGRIFG
ncbi:MAG: response regulator [Anaerolineae bacterium]|nr:response regulator [Anaerolineae bacterium]NIO00398.1 response regulator [Anaerolineae bacterium]NIQ83168.1 response regulator [Anaerolineae bacterium]